MITLQEFIDKWNGVGIDYDGAYGFQCQDLYRMYVKEVLGFPQSPGVAGAKDNWDVYLPQYYDRIANTPDGVPEPGDIMIWGAKYGPYGHVAVVTKATLTTFTCFSQNDPLGTLPTLKTYKTYTPTLGWLHPKKNPDVNYRGLDLTNVDSMKVCVDDHMRIVEGQLVDKTLYETLKGQFTETQKRIDELNSELGSANSTIQALTSKVQSLNNIVGEYQKEDATQLEQLIDAQTKATKYSDMYFLLLRGARAEVKLSSTVDDTTKAEKELYDAIGSLYQTNTSYEKRIKELELSKKPIHQYTKSELIVELIKKLTKFEAKTNVKNNKSEKIT